MQIVKFETAEDKIIDIRGEKVIIDSDVTELYGVETRDINKAVKNNPDKFPEGYTIELTKEELNNLRWKISTAKLSMTRVFPKAFTEKGLYMLATIIKSPEAVKTTLDIIEAYAKIRNLSKNIGKLPNVKDKAEQKNIMERTGRIIGDILDEAFAVLRVKHTIKKGKK